MSVIEKIYHTDQVRRDPSTSREGILGFSWSLGRRPSSLSEAWIPSQDTAAYDGVLLLVYDGMAME